MFHSCYSLKTSSVYPAQMYIIHPGLESGFNQWSSPFCQKIFVMLYSFEMSVYRWFINLLLKQTILIDWSLLFWPYNFLTHCVPPLLYHRNLPSQKHNAHRNWTYPEQEFTVLFLVPWLMGIYYTHKRYSLCWKQEFTVLIWSNDDVFRHRNPPYSEQEFTMHGLPVVILYFRMESGTGMLGNILTYNFLCKSCGFF